MTLSCSQTFSRNGNTRTHTVYHTSYTVPPVVELMKLTGDNQQVKKKRKKGLEGLKGTYTRYGLLLQATITRGRMPDCFYLRKTTSLVFEHR